jgi:phenylacetate-CoA ligase
MAEHFDALELRDPDLRESAMMARLPDLVAHAKAHAPAMAAALVEVDPSAVASRAALASLPVTRKADLIEAQRRDPPFAGLTATRVAALARVFRSPGPINDPEGRGRDWWRFARALFAAGFRPGDLIQNCFSYHFTPAGMMVEGGARRLGCPVFPAGTGNTEAQAQAMAELRVAGYAGTPSFLRLILEKAVELGLDHRSCRVALVSGEALTAPLRQALADLGCVATQCYASADLGLIAYETPAREGMVVDEEVLVEILRPGTGDPVPDGEVGEVVVTSFNQDYPLIRFATGDLSAVMPGVSACGRTNRRIKGWMGRADQSAKIKGMFVHPAQVAEIARRHPEIARARLIVDRDGDSDRMTLVCAVVGTAAAGLGEAIAGTLQTVTKLRGAVELVAVDRLPNDGKVIEDKRS